jgi:hypothetical protein
MADKDYEPPTSEGLTGDELDDVAAGAGGNVCETGRTPPTGNCGAGEKPPGSLCRMGTSGQ